MKKTKYLLIILVSILMVTIKVEAKFCGSDDIATLKKIAEGVNISYEFINNEQEGKMFLITFYNIDKEIKLVAAGEDKITIEGMYDSETGDYINTIRAKRPDVHNVVEMTFDVYAKDADCYKESLRTITIKTPRYNELSDTELCKDNPNHEDCKELVDTNEKKTLQELKENIENKKLEARKKTKSIILYMVIGVILLVAAVFGVRYYTIQKKMKDRGVI